MRQRAAAYAIVALALCGAPPAAADTLPLTEGWSIQSAAVARAPGSTVSQPTYNAAGWLTLTQPETLMAGLLEHGRYPGVFFADRLAAVPTAPFRGRWWYREALDLHPAPGQHTFITMNGVLSRANLWVNGRKVADASQLQGAYSQFEYDVTTLVRDGRNAIALDVYPNDSGDHGFLTLNMVDWNPPSPDGWTGLQLAPDLAQDGPLSLRDTHVVQRDAPGLTRADLTVQTRLRNNSDQVQVATLNGVLTGPNTEIRFTRKASVPPHTTRLVSIGRSAVPALRLRHPAVWWPYQMGAQPLYRLQLEADVLGARSDTASATVGIRTVSSRLTAVVKGRTYGRSGYRQFLINGRPFVVRGGGWSQELFLRSSPQNTADQLAYVKDLGLNAIRFEGNLPPDDLFQQLDAQGILALPGWQCCDRWEQDSSRWTAGLRRNAANQALHVARWLRDHPSVLGFYQGSDEEPDPAKEAIYLRAFTAAGFTQPMIASAEYKASRRLGPAGSKEGPYNYAPPAYWWDATPHMDSGGTFTNAGGAFGFDTEASPGNTIPTADSLARFLTDRGQAAIWDPASTHGLGSGPFLFHTSPPSSYTGIARLGQYNTALWRRYGPWSNLTTYEREAQAGGYEVTRALFEAYVGHSKDRANPSTGIIYWQLNKAWPSLQWQLYGSDFDQSGVYFGAKKANEPVHVLYAYDTHGVKVANLTNQRQTGLRVRAEVIDLAGTVRLRRAARVPPLGSQDVRAVLGPIAPPAGTSTTYFLRLQLVRGSVVVSRNVYWLSTKPDVIDWAHTIGKGTGAAQPAGGFADLTGLRNLPPAPVEVHATTHADGTDDETTVTLTNTGHDTTPAFLVRADVRRSGVQGDDQVLPIRWTDNDVTLWPGESVTLVARYRNADLKGALPVVSVSGWNVQRRLAAAPVG